jgi:hypothetical protein
MWKKFPHVRTTCGKRPTPEAFLSRMGHGDRYRDELIALQESNPEAEKEARRMLPSMFAAIVDCRVTFERIKSPHDNANASTKHNASERGKIKAAKMQRARVPKGGSRLVATGPRPDQRKAHDPDTK